MWDDMWGGLPWAGLLSSFLLLFFLLSNWLYDRGWAFYQSRKVAHFAAGIGIVLLPLLFRSIVYPLLLSGSFLLLLIVLHHTDVFRGFTRKGRLSEVYFPLSVLICITVAWNINPWLAVSPALMLSFGDGITGVIRQYVYKREVKGSWGSLGMLIVSLGVSVPFLGWIGVPGAVVATLAEKLCGDVGRFKVDDNLTVPLVALAVMLPLYVLGWKL